MPANDFYGPTLTGRGGEEILLSLYDEKETTGIATGVSNDVEMELF